MHMMNMNNWIRIFISIYVRRKFLKAPQLTSRQGCILICRFASQFAIQFGPIANQTSNWFATLRIKNKRKYAIKKGEFTWILPKETTDLTLYLNINYFRPFSRTTVTFKMISIKMWYLIRTAVIKLRINSGQLRIKRQIDSQLCDSICAAYVQAC